jgi:hypothetical protein
MTPSGFAKTVANHQQPQPGTHSKEKKAVFPFGMFVVVEFDCVLVVEDRSRFFK